VKEGTISHKEGSMLDYTLVFTAFISAGSALLGVGMTFVFQLVLRTEKFKELVYKERLAVYKQLIECATEIVHLWPLMMVKSMPHLEDPAGRDKLSRELARYPFLLSLAEYIAADQVLDPAAHFRQLTMASVKEDERRIHYGKIVGTQLALIRAVRADLGVDPIAEDIKKTLHDNWTAIAARLTEWR